MIMGLRPSANVWAYRCTSAPTSTRVSNDHSEMIKVRLRLSKTFGTVWRTVACHLQRAARVLLLANSVTSLNEQHCI